MLYRLLRPEENWQDGLMAKDSFSVTSVLDHVINGSNPGWQSRFISTSGSLNAVMTFNRGKLNPIIVKIWEKNLPMQIIDLRTPEERRGHYIVGSCGS